MLEQVQDVTLTLRRELPQVILQSLPPNEVSEFSGSASGTLIRVRNSNAILGFVGDVTPNELQSRIVSVQGF